LLGTAIEPIFVFDGPRKPEFKRNKRSGRGDGVATAAAKKLISLFGFTVHDAPAEAEAECALLQRQGIVDAVLSEDVDTIMFGCGRTLRDWTSEGSRGSKTPTHVTLYDAAEVATTSGLDRQGMVLVALMAGGDYLPEGIPGCGVKVACEAARAGFGRDLCRIKGSDKVGLVAWRERLRQELATNESGYFRTRHKALVVPESFPSLKVLRYYTHPVVSQQETLDRLRLQLSSTKEVDAVELREFVRNTFDWTYKIGAVKFVRVVSESLLVQRLVRECRSPEAGDDADANRELEAALIKSISSKREHFSTDATPELRVSYIPADVVGIDLHVESEEQVEAYGRQGLALNSDDEFDAAEESEQPVGGSSKKPFDPFQPALSWVPQSIIEMALPVSYCDWKDRHDKKTKAPTKRTTRSKKTGMPVGALDSYFAVTKGAAPPKAQKSTESSQPSAVLPFPQESVSTTLGPTGVTRSKPKEHAPVGKRGRRTNKSADPKPQLTTDVNPWTLASTLASPKASRSANSSGSAKLKSSSLDEPILIPSSPPGAAEAFALGAGVDAEIQTTPLRRSKRASTSPTPVVSPIATTEKHSTGQNKTSLREVPAATAPRARPFKRTKSGAESELQPTTSEPTTHKVGGTQSSIKIFGRVLRSAPASAIIAKQSEPETYINISSDDESVRDDNTSSLPSSQKASREIASDSTGSGATVAGAHLRGGYVPDVETSELEAIPKKSATPGTAVRLSARSSKSPFPPDILPVPSTSSSSDAPGDSSLAHSRAKATTGTTKLFMPRASGVGEGFFSEVEVAREDTDPPPTSSSALSGPGIRRAGKFWRRSEIGMIDLTGED